MALMFSFTVYIVCILKHTLKWNALDIICGIFIGVETCTNIYTFYCVFYTFFKNFYFVADVLKVINTDLLN
jgi:hypothetical protein